MGKTKSCVLCGKENEHEIGCLEPLIRNDAQYEFAAVLSEFLGFIRLKGQVKDEEVVVSVEGKSGQSYVARGPNLQGTVLALAHQIGQILKEENSYTLIRESHLRQKIMDGYEHEKEEF